MNRYRLVTHQGGAQHVSSVVLSHAEALEALDLEEDMHQAAGWLTARLRTNGEWFDSVYAYNKKTSRMITIRESSPMEDTL